MTTQQIECRGWKEICEFLRVRNKTTAKKILKRTGLLMHDGNKPVLNVIAYQKASIRRHITK